MSPPNTITGRRGGSLPPEAPATRMTARSRLATRAGPGASVISVLRAEAPLLLRPTRATGPDPWQVPGAARVSLTAGAVGPIGGDDYRLDVDVGAASTLVLGDVSPTLLLPGPDGAASRYTVTVTVGADATLIWLAEPLIAAAGCHHRQRITVDLHPSARLVLREELLLGRSGETCGTVAQHSAVRRGGRSLHRADLTVGPDAPGYDGPAVLGGARAVGSLLVVDPGRPEPPAGRVLSGRAAVLELAGPAALISAVAENNLALRRDLTAGLVHLGLIG